MLRMVGKYNVELYSPDIKTYNDGPVLGLMIISVFVGEREVGRKQFYYHDPNRLKDSWMRSLAEAKVKEIYAKPQNTKFYFGVEAKKM